MRQLQHPWLSRCQRGAQPVATRLILVQFAALFYIYMRCGPITYLPLGIGYVSSHFGNFCGIQILQFRLYLRSISAVFAWKSRRQKAGPGACAYSRNIFTLGLAYFLPLMINLSLFVKISLSQGAQVQGPPKHAPGGNYSLMPEPFLVGIAQRHATEAN